MEPSQAASLIAQMVLRGKSLGHEYIIFDAPRRGGNSPKNWDRARIAGGRPSLWGRCVGPGNLVGYWRYDVKIKDAEAWLAGNFESVKENLT